MNCNLQDKTALVTGAGRGIGRSICTNLASAGATVVCTARSGDQIEQAAALINENGGRACAIPADVANEEEVLSLFRRIRQEFGTLDVLVNNAGVGRYGPVAEFTADALDEMLAVNVRGAFLCCREGMKMMIPQRSGYIINIASVVAFKGYPNQAGYTASKHAIMGLTKSLAVEAQEHDVRVSVISPGGVDTEMVRNSRPDLDPSVLLQPDDVAQAILYLLSLSDRAAVDEIYIRRRTSKPF